MVINTPVEPPLATFVDSELQLRVWLVREWIGVPRNVQHDEHDQIAWFGVADATQLDLADPRYLAVLRRAASTDAR